MRAKSLPLKALLFATMGLILLSPILGTALSLSLDGIRHLYLWQFITYAFVYPSPQGITFPFLLYLAINLYILWVFGSSLISRIRTVPFLALYISSIVVGGLAAYGALALLNLPQFYAGIGAPLYATLITWAMLNPEAELLLFFAIPFKPKWPLLILVGADLLVSATHRDWISCSSNLAVFLYAYLFSLIAFRARSSFAFMAPFEAAVLRAAERLHNFRKKKDSFPPTKIYDFKTGAPVLTDDQFMDAMLARISEHGEDSLSPEEKKRMKEISERKAREKK